MKESKLKSYFKQKTTLFSLAMSASAAFFMWCFLAWYVYVAFAEAHTHPLGHSMSIVGMLLFAVTFILSFILYCKKRSQNISFKLIVFDILLFIGALPIFSVLCWFGLEILERMF